MLTHTHTQLTFYPNNKSGGGGMRTSSCLGSKFPFPSTFNIILWRWLTRGGGDLFPHNFCSLKLIDGRGSLPHRKHIEDRLVPPPHRLRLFFFISTTTTLNNMLIEGIFIIGNIAVVLQIMTTTNVHSNNAA